MNIWEQLNEAMPRGWGPEDTRAGSINKGGTDKAHSYEYDEHSTKELCQKIAKGEYKAHIDENGVLWLNDGTKSLGYGTWVRADKA